MRPQHPDLASVLPDSTLGFSIIVDAIFAGKLSQSRLAAFVLNHRYVDLGFVKPLSIWNLPVVIDPAAFENLLSCPTVLKWNLNLFEGNPLS